MEPNTGFTSEGTYDSGPPDSYPDAGSSPRAPELADPGWASVMEFTAADVFQHSPFGDMLYLLKSLSLSGDSGPNYVRLEWEADNDGIRCPPTTHFIATIDDLTDMLDFDSKDIDDMDDDVGESQEPPLTGRWTATSSYDIYIWWTLRRKLMAMRQRRTTPREENQRMGVVGAAPSPAIATPAPEAKIIRMAPKKNMTLISPPLSRTNRKTSRSSQKNRR